MVSAPARRRPKEKARALNKSQMLKCLDAKPLYLYMRLVLLDKQLNFCNKCEGIKNNHKK